MNPRLCELGELTWVEPAIQSKTSTWSAVNLKKKTDLRPTFESYLFRRSQRCSLAGQLSNAAPVSCGIPQGSNLGPLLFLVYIGDLPNCPHKVDPPRMFADDTNITFAARTLTDLEKGLNSELRSLNLWLISNKLSLNVAKTNLWLLGQTNV